MSLDEYLQPLGRAFGFTLDELRCNQQGTLHPGQVARGRRQGRVAFAVLALLGAISLVGGMLGAQAYREAFATGGKEAQQLLGACLVLAAFFFACAGVSLARRRRRQARYALGRVETVQGPLWKVHVRGRGGIPDRYRFRVEGRGFDTTRQGWELLTHGAVYRLHTLDGRLLSLAPVLHDAPDRAECDRDAAQFERTQSVRPSRQVR